MPDFSRPTREPYPGGRQLVYAALPLTHACEVTVLVGHWLLVLLGDTLPPKILAKNHPIGNHRVGPNESQIFRCWL